MRTRRSSDYWPITSGVVFKTKFPTCFTRNHHYNRCRRRDGEVSTCRSQETGSRGHHEPVWHLDRIQNSTWNIPVRFRASLHEETGNIAGSEAMQGECVARHGRRSEREGWLGISRAGVPISLGQPLPKQTSRRRNQRTPITSCQWPIQHCKPREIGMTRQVRGVPIE